MKRLGLLVVAIALAATACGGGDSVFDMSVGDCFNAPADLEVSRVEVITCDGPHDHEVYLLFDIDSGDFPGADEVASRASDGCLAEFDAYVGSEYAESALDIGFLPPSESTWDKGDREVVCYLLDFSGAVLTAPAKGSGL